MQASLIRLTSWLTRILRDGGSVSRRRIGASAIRPVRRGWPAQHQRRTQEARAIAGLQPLAWDCHRNVKGQFCKIVGGVLSPLLANVALDGMERLFGAEDAQGRYVRPSLRRGPNRGVGLIR